MCHNCNPWKIKHKTTVYSGGKYRADPYTVFWVESQDVNDVPEKKKKKAAAMEMSAEDTPISHVTENHTAGSLRQKTAPAASMEYQHSWKENNLIPHAIVLHCIPAGLT